MKKSATQRALVLAIVAVIVVGIVALVFVAPIIAAAVFVLLVVACALGVGKKEGGWKGFVAFAKDLIFGW
jgi:hypothetical protein